MGVTFAPGLACATDAPHQLSQVESEIESNDVYRVGLGVRILTANVDSKTRFVLGHQ